MATRKEKLMISGLRTVLNGTARLSHKRAGRLAYRLLAQPRRHALNEQATELLDSAEQRTLRIDGIDIATYYWPGTTERTALLLHGWESCTGRWREQTLALIAAGYHVYAFDAPAHGRSGGTQFTVVHYARTLSAYLTQLPAVPAHWIGHSAGGMAAIYYLTKYKQPSLPKRMALLGVPAHVNDFVDAFCSVLGFNQRVRSGLDKEFQRRLDFPIHELDFVAYLDKIDIPGLLVHDRQDEVGPYEGARRLHQTWTDSELFTTEGLGHSLPGPEVVAAVMGYFLSSRG